MCPCNFFGGRGGIVNGGLVNIHIQNKKLAFLKNFLNFFQVEETTIHQKY